MTNQNQLKLSPQAEAIQQKLVQLIQEKIRNSDTKEIGFDDFVNMALYEPQLGYYQNNLRTFGEQGDFITAPEMGNLFAHGIAKSIKDALSEAGMSILEIGAGSGQLATDLLLTFNNENLKYLILEPSATLQSLQNETIKTQADKFYQQVTWLNNLPENFEGIIIANEVMDAIPCQMIQKQEDKQDGWHYLNVGLDEGGGFVWQAGEAVELSSLPAALQSEDYPADYMTELRPWLSGWIKGLSKCLKKGAVLLFDYGYGQSEYYHSQRLKGTLQCFSRHTKNDNPFQLVGLQDITAHVDFTQVIETAHNEGFDIEGYTTQAGFLIENGILDQQAAVDEKQQYMMSQQIQKLTTQGQMGEIIKVIGLSKQMTADLKGFDLQCQLHRL
ncbi:MAG: SAM-dependent methyltransferase [Gammaproteobacteria bacterium]|nr:SAM-dependent methyltransferase [Gammaproteobacteria bacterium]